MMTKKVSVTVSPKRLNRQFVEKVTELSGENLHLCYQCGMCTGNCPAVANMDISPRRIIELARLGLEDDISGSKTVWTCATCLACTVNCPRGFDLSKLMEAIRLLTLRKNINHVRPEDIPPQERCELPQMAMVSALRKFTG
jgi:heterodisulfide reductase subunit C